MTERNGKPLSVPTGAPAPPPCDDAERERAAKDLDKTFLVEAAAGTGKTTLLVRRVLSILRSGRAALSEIAAITFTDKAAGELKLRLRAEIEKALREARDAGDPAGRHLQAALEELQGMTACTIHRFCADMLRERPVEGLVEPAFAVADELTSSLLLDEAWERWIAEQMSGENVPLRRALEAGLDITKHLRLLAQELADNRDALNPPKFAPCWRDDEMRRAVDSVRKSVAEIRASLTECSAPGSDRAALQIAALAEWADGLDGNDFDHWALWIERAPRCNPKAGSKENWRGGDSLKRVKSQFEELKGTMDDLSAQITHRIVSELAAALAPFLREHEATKEAAGMLDFMDLLLKARNMLRDNAAAREYFKRSWRFILVDEFQDTDPLQTEIVFFLAEREGENAGDWRAARLEPGKLFIVGDPKQSIYRFRRADLELYGQVKEAIAAQGEVLQLSANFRTVPGILGEVNALFRPLMQGPTDGGYEPVHVELMPHRRGGTKQPVKLLYPSASLDTTEFRAPEWRKAEADCIASGIHELVESHTLLPDGKGGGRKAGYGDVAVLYRFTTGLEELEQALRARGIPYLVAGGKHYFSRQEFEDLLVTLRAIDDPYDSVSVVGALRTPFFGRSDEDLLEHVSSGGDFDYRRPPSEEAAGPLAEAFAALRRFHELRRTAPPAQLLAGLLETTQAAAIYALKPYGPQRVANLLKAQEMARALAQAGRGTFGALLEWLRTRAQAGAAEEEGLFQEEGEGEFVRLMTFHKAKGLEFPVVFLANLGHDERNRDTALVERAGGLLHLDLGKSARTLGWEQALKAEKERQSHEEDRLLYVAMTRAREMLFLPLFWWSKRDAGLLRRLKDRYGEESATEGAEPFGAAALGPAADYNDGPVRRPKPQEPLPPAAQAALAERQAWRERLNARIESLNCRAASTSASRAMAESRGEEQNDEASVRRMDFGSLTHRLMELLARDERLDLSRLARIEAAQMGMGEADAVEAAALAARSWQSPALRRARAAGNAQAEVPFTAQTPRGLLEGRVDLVFIEGGQAVILDYKTNDVDAAAVRAEAEKYLPQARIYAAAISTALRMPVREVVFIFLRPGVEVAFGGAELI